MTHPIAVQIVESVMEDNDALSCSVCFLPFLENKKPVFCPNRHTQCEFCFYRNKEILKPSPMSTACPICRTQIPLPPQVERNILAASTIAAPLKTRITQVLNEKNKEIKKLKMQNAQLIRKKKEHQERIKTLRSKKIKTSKNAEKEDEEEGQDMPSIPTALNENDADILNLPITQGFPTNDPSLIMLTQPPAQEIIIEDQPVLPAYQ